ncbi:uncharacterized protein STEHIDRAFT_163769 [Stereum hirsutum FP-91666 SS1]|uniref:G-protein coupled receptors family 2 profile 2 domain-containing protein n=1 Tax=Stereum hirsutum (strain FP-91666) TaxID=721885 RepID=R7RVX7_STEHR|nr:uncharacterized protein STEHIDRAFT_163769 [Stereum hirsutum FP-91666 SS1]EIM79411.1 hypothetical protein STEHIDRAFT_163769 [Stereum hirsutum FP-91666 SS1]
MTFVFTPKMQSISNRIWTITSADSKLFLSTSILILGTVTSLDRTALGAAGAAAGSLAAPSWGCGFSVFIFQYSLEFTNFMLFCVALNLQLVVVHRCNGRRMEKFYIIGSILISGALTIPPYAADQYGWDPLEDVCWYGNSERGPRISWEIGTQLTWGTLTALGELCASTTVIMILLINYVRVLPNQNLIYTADSSVF